MIQIDFHSVLSWQVGQRWFGRVQRRDNGYILDKGCWIWSCQRGGGVKAEKQPKKKKNGWFKTFAHFCAKCVCKGKEANAYKWNNLFSRSIIQYLIICLVFCTSGHFHRDCHFTFIDIWIPGHNSKTPVEKKVANKI